MEIINNFGVNAPIGNSDHCLVYVCLNIPVPDKRAIQFISYRNFSAFDENTFYRSTQSINWNAIKNFNTLDEKVDFLQNSLTSIFDKHAPTHTAKITNNDYLSFRAIQSY